MLGNISHEFSSKEQLGKPLSDKLSKIVNSLFLTDMEEEKLQIMIKKYHRQENCINVVAPKINSEICNENLPVSHRVTIFTSEKFNC